MQRLITAPLLAATLVCIALVEPAAAQVGPSVRPTVSDHDAEISIYHRESVPGRDGQGVQGARRGRRGSTMHCELREFGSGGTDAGSGFTYGDQPVTDLTPGRRVFRVCRDSLTGEPGTNGLGGVDVVTLGSGAGPGAVFPVITGFDLAELALARLPIALPTPHLNPSAREVVHLPTWLWVDDQPTPTTSVSLAGITATLTARLDDVIWDMGDGTSVRCDGPGTPYDPAKDPAAQRTSCSRTPTSGIGRFAVTVTTRWRVSFSATDGTGGGLGVLTRTATVPTEVVELETVVRDR